MGTLQLDRKRSAMILAYVATLILWGNAWVAEGFRYDMATGYFAHPNGERRIILGAQVPTRRKL